MIRALGQVESLVQRIERRADALGGVSAVMLAGTAGFVVGLLIMLHPIWTLSPTSEYRASLAKPEVLLWVLICSTLIAFCFVVAVPVLSIVLRLREYFAGNLFKISVALFNLLVLIVAIPVASRLVVIPDSFDLGVQFPYVFAKTFILYSVCFIVAAVAATGTWLVYAGLKSTQWRVESREERVKLYLRFRDYLQKLLWILGIILGLGILATGAFAEIRNMPSLYVFTYGAALSMIVILFYVPTYLALVAAGRDLTESLAPLPSPDSPSWGDAYKKRKDVEEFLEVNVTAQSNLRSGIAILTPLLSGIVSLLIPK